jgi:tetratricopeptide (TPR) repeat protein
LVRTSTQDFIARGEGMGLTVSHWVTAALYNGLARYEDAFAAAAQAAADPHELWFSTFAAVELIEAASRSGRSQRAAEALELLSESTRASGTPWAQGVEARSRALLNRGEAAETLYREAIARLQPTRLLLDLARAHLLYGEWLRRQRRRLDARTELRVAHDLFSDFGMAAFAERARGSSCRRQASGPANGPWIRSTNSPRRRRRSPGLPRKGTPTERSPPSCSSARARSNITYARRSASST